MESKVPAVPSEEVIAESKDNKISASDGATKVSAPDGATKTSSEEVEQTESKESKVGAMFSEEGHTESRTTTAPIKGEDQKSTSRIIVTEKKLNDKTSKRGSSFNPRITSVDWIGQYAGDTIDDVPMGNVFADAADVPFDKEFLEHASCPRGVSCDELIKEYMNVERHFTSLMGVPEPRTAKKCDELPTIKKEVKKEGGGKISSQKAVLEAPPSPPSMRLATGDIIKTNYCEPTDLDVLLGRGGLTNHHHGNKLYREQADKLRDWYVKCTKREKYHVSELLVKYVKSYGGRFLEHDEVSGQWYEAPKNRARKKASQALREYKKRKHK